MTIKDIETRSGMTRANIRFYESQGLLSPVRSDNGYRSYSEQDLETLQRIKLLRALHISLEEIKAVQAGKRELEAVLDEQLERLSGEQRELERAQQVCREMRADRVRYDTLNAEKYLNNPAGAPIDPAPELAADVEPRVWAPCRRLFARCFDLYLCESLWFLLLTGCFRVNIIAWTEQFGLLDFVVPLALMLLFEPLFLHFFAVTPGKWILGLRVTDDGGGKLSFRAARSRTWTALWRGMGLLLPIYDLVRLYKSYRAYGDGETLPWEYDSTLTAKKSRLLRAVCLAGCYGALFAGLVLSSLNAAMPVFRGELTVEQFCDNYNHYLDFYGYSGNRLTPAGEWEEEKQSGVVVVDAMGEAGPPQVAFTQRDGVLTGVTLELSLPRTQDLVSSCQTEMALSMLSFALAQEKADLFRRETDPVLEQIEDHPFEDFSMSAYGVKLTCSYRYSGFEAFDGFLWPQDGEESNFDFRFSMEKMD